MGIWPVARGQLTGVRPLGLTRPVTTSPIAVPASLPRNHAASRASARSTSHGTTSGRPENNTTMTGFLAERARSNTASANKRCRPGSPRSARLAASPLMPAASPKQSRMASAVAQSSSAAAMPETSSPSIETPAACRISASGLTARSPATTLICPSASAAPHQGPRISAGASASGPKMASRRCEPPRGSVCASFLSMTIARAATLRASRRRCARTVADSGLAPRR